MMDTVEIQHACCQGEGNCRSYEDCQRRAVAIRVSDLVRKWDKLRIKRHETATVAGIDETALSRLLGGSTPPVRLSRLLDAEKRLKAGILPQRRQFLIDVVGDLKELASATVSPLDHCAIGEVTEAQQTEASEAICWNVMLGLLGDSTSERRRLPTDMEGVYNQFGDPSLGIVVIQTDPPPASATLDERIAHQKRVVHEMRDGLTRERAQLRKLVAQRKNPSSARDRKQRYRLS